MRWKRFLFDSNIERSRQGISVPALLSIAAYALLLRQVYGASNRGSVR
jgi:hypothetical protein